MADEKKKRVTVFGGVLDAINANRRKKDTLNTQAPGMGVTQSMPALDPQQGVEGMQQQFLDWQVTKIAHDLYTRTVYYDTDRISAYQDFRAMDGTPEIAAALNIIRDECVIYSLPVPLMCGKSLTVEELYQQNYKNFEVYSYNPILKRHEPAICEKVVYKGEQDCYKVIFDDDSYIETTSEHLWLLKGKNEYIKTSDLKENMSIEPFYTKISNEDDKIHGYEMILENGKWEYTHRIVKRKFWPEKKGVAHHKDINKLNNESSNIDIMSWYEHQNLHHTLNSQRWENNDEYSQKMRKIFSKTNSNEGPYWSNEEWKRNRIGEMCEERRERFKNYTEEELKEMFGYSGEKNPMYNKGYKITDNRNGRFLENVRREFTKEEIVEAFESSFDIYDVCRLLETKRRILNKSKSYKEIGLENLKKLLKKRNRKDFQHLDINLVEDECKKYLGKIILETQPSMTLIADNLGWTFTEMKICLSNNGYRLWKDFAKKYNSSECLLQNIKQKFIGNGYKSLKYFCKDEGVSINVAKKAIKRSSYKNLPGLLLTANHKIKKVEYSGKYRTYDLVNVGEYNNFAVLTSDKKSGVFVHNCLTRSEKGNILEVYSEDKRVKQVLNDLFKNVLNVDFNLRLWIRDLVKYGDYFVLLQIDKEVGIYDFLTLPMEEVHREEGYDGRTSSIRFRWETTGDYFEEWRVAHFRLLEDSRKLPYGRSILDSSRKLWKQLQLAEDAMLVYRITRAPERRVFYIEVGNLPDADVKQYMGKVQNQIRKQPIVDTRTGNMTQKYDPENVTEDYWIPIRGDKSSKIETLPGAANLGDIHDIEYLQNKLFAALQVPKTYLNFAESMPGGSTLSQADIRFSRTINSIQEAILLELRRVANVHLYFLGFEDDLDNFHLTLTNPSTQQELLKLETMKARLEVFKEFFNTEATAPSSYTWAMENVLGFSKSDIKLMLKQKKVEKKIFAEIDSAVETYKKIGLFDELDERYEDPEAAAAAAAGGAASGEEGGEGGGDFGGGGGFGGLGGGLDLGTGAPPMGGEEAGAAPEGGEAGAAPEGGEEAPPMAEGKIIKIMKESDKRMNNFINELLGPDEKIISLMKENAKREDNVLVKKNKSMNIKTKKLLESIDRTLNSFNVEDVEKNVITEDGEQSGKTENALFENNEKNNQKIKEIFDDLDKITYSEE